MTPILNNLTLVKFVNNNEYAAVVWHSKDCPVCDFFITELKKIKNEQFIFGEIDTDDWEDHKLLEPELGPTTFLFKNGNRVLVAPGQAPLSVVEEMLDNISSLQNRAKNSMYI